MTKIHIENGCYGTKRGNIFTALTNCTVNLTQPVLAGSLSGYLGVATHKDGTQRRFFLPHNGDRPLSSDMMAAVVNHGIAGEAGFQKRMFFNIPSAMLRNLVGDLVDHVDIPERPLKAVNIVGKNVGWDDEPVWVFNNAMAINKFGRVVDPAAHGLVWIGHLVAGNNKDVAIHEEGCAVATPLSTVAFDTMCHFMAGTLPYRMVFDAAVTDFVSKAFSKFPEEIAIQAAYDEPAEKNCGFLSAFFLVAQAVLIANYEEWQKINGCCPLAVGVGIHGSGKTSAGKVALACTGGYPMRFLSNFTNKGCARVAASNTMGFQADDPTDAKDLGDAAKRFFDAGTDVSFKGEFTPRCSPLFTVNDHVIDWLLKAQRARLLDRLLIIKFPQRQPCSTQDESTWQTHWSRRFTTLLDHLSSTVGEVIRLGQWLHSGEGTTFFEECLKLAEEGLGEASKGSRIASSWACGILVARKMAECTSAVEDVDLVRHYKEYLAPYVSKLQLQISEDGMVSGPEMKQDFLNSFEGSLLMATSGITQQTTVRGFLRTDCITNLKGQGETNVVAVRLKKLNEVLGRGGNPKLGEGVVRDNIEKLDLGLRATEQRFWSPTKRTLRSKGCVAIRRALFTNEVLATLDKAAGANLSNCSQEQVTKVDLSREEEREKLDKEVQVDSKNEAVHKEVQVGVEVDMSDKAVQVDLLLDHHNEELQAQAKKFEDLADDRAKEIEFLQEQLRKQGNKERERVVSSDHDSDECPDQSSTNVLLNFGDVVYTPKPIEVAATSGKAEGKKRKGKGLDRQTRKKTCKDVQKDKCNLCHSDNKKNWVCCDICQQWQHSSCVGLSHSEAEKMGRYVCRDCDCVQ